MAHIPRQLITGQQLALLAGEILYSFTVRWTGNFRMPK